jgi:hypothetical protein
MVCQQVFLCYSIFMAHGKPHHKHSESGHGKGESEQQPGQPPAEMPPSPPESQTQQPPNGGCIPHQSQRDWLDYFTFFLQVIGLGVLIAYTAYAGLSWCEMRKAANAARDSVNVARDTLVASNRPWLDAEVQTTGPLIFDDQGGRLRIKVTLKNVGHSPAVMAWSDEELYLASNPELDTKIERGKQCDLTVQRSFKMGQTIFPGTDGVGGLVNLQSQGTPQKVGFTNPTIIVCVAYQSALNDKTQYFTSMIYDLWEAGEGAERLGITYGRGVPFDRLRFSLSFFHGVLTYETKNKNEQNPN